MASNGKQWQAMASNGRQWQAMAGSGQRSGHLHAVHKVAQLVHVQPQCVPRVRLLELAAAADRPEARLPVGLPLVARAEKAVLVLQRRPDAVERDRRAPHAEDEAEEARVLVHVRGRDDEIEGRRDGQVEAQGVEGVDAVAQLLGRGAARRGRGRAPARGPPTAVERATERAAVGACRFRLARQRERRGVLLQLDVLVAGREAERRVERSAEGAVTARGERAAEAQVLVK